MLKSISKLLAYKDIQSSINCAKKRSLPLNKIYTVIDLNPVSSKLQFYGGNCSLNYVKFFHSSSNLLSDENRSLINFEDFRNQEKKNRQTFMEAIQIYEKNFPTRKGHVEFIESALKQMKEYGVHEDLEAYRSLVNILPKGVFVVKNKMQIALHHYPNQQGAIIQLLHQMEAYGVIPDVELGQLLYDIFGDLSNPFLKLRRQLYWSSKFKNKSPWPLPKELPCDQMTLGKMAVERITSVDIQTDISVFKTEVLTESVDKTWIVSGQSREQRELLKKHPLMAPVIVEGGNVVWLRGKFISYFVLKADVTEPYKYEPPPNEENLLNIQSEYFNPTYTKKVEKIRSVHEQDDGVIYAVAVTGTSSKDSLLSWVRLLQKKDNPILEKVPVLFRFKSAERVPVPV